MRAHRIEAPVTPGQPLPVTLPPDWPEGNVEVINLFPGPVSSEGAFSSLSELNTCLRQQPPGSRTKEEIERHDLATELWARQGLETPDALHLAAAIRSGREGLWTNDTRLATTAAEHLRIVVFEETE